MVKTVSFGSAISLTERNLVGSSKNWPYLYKDGRDEKSLKTFYCEFIEHKNIINKFWYPLTDFLLLLQK